MLLKEEEIKSHLRLDDGLYSDGDLLKLLAQAVQKRTETYLNRKLYAPEETIPEDDPDGIHLTDDIRLAMLMLVSHFYENRSASTDVEKLETPVSFRWLAGPYRIVPL
ncbi:TPA: head-tail connector protein [Escherichia coli]|uniref:head-tail connector protein n=1 Tax=Escherichia coli TaxID=562 RepID=UPI00396CD4F8